MSVVAVAFTFALAGAMLAAVFNRASEIPVLAVVIGGALAIGLGFSPSLQPIRDLAQGAERVGAGDFSQRLPVVQDDDLGALAASFNRMQAGLAERQRLQAALGTYVDPGPAARLLEQGDDVFTGERREVTVMFVDIISMNAVRSAPIRLAAAESIASTPGCCGGVPRDDQELACPMPSLVEWQTTSTGWVQVFADAERAGHTALNLAVDDLENAVNELIGRGLAPGEIQTANTGVRLSALTDPDGKTITLIGGFREVY